MFGFVFVMVLFYDVICDIIGLNGKIFMMVSIEGLLQVVEDCIVIVEFIIQWGEGVSGDFMLVICCVEVYFGEIMLVNFFVSNFKFSDIIM